MHRRRSERAVVAVRTSGERAGGLPRATPWVARASHEAHHERASRIHTRRRFTSVVEMTTSPHPLSSTFVIRTLCRGACSHPLRSVVASTYCLRFALADYHNTNT